MLKLIMAVSADGYLARGPSDDMAWTGGADKAVFRLLTSVGADCAAGRRTWEQMPDLPHRRLVPLTRQEGRLVHKASDATGARPELSMCLGSFAHAHPNGWLLGGPSVAYEALDVGLVDQVYLCRSPAVLHGEQPAFRPPYRDEVTPWLMSRGESHNAGIPWRRAHRIQLDGVTVDCWSRRDAFRS